MQLEVAVKVLIQNHKEQYLLIQRSEPLPDGTGIKWDIPGGRVNPAERLEEALAREVQEEVGITISSKIKLINAEDVFVPNTGLHVVRLTYSTRFSSEVKLGREHQRFVWVSREEALNLDIDTCIRTSLALAVV